MPGIGASWNWEPRPDGPRSAWLKAPAAIVSIDQEDPSEAREWCRRYQVDGTVEFLQGRIEQIVPRLEERFDMAFVDIGHDRESVARAIEASLRILEPGGLVAFQGYPDPCWPEVRQVVDDHANRLSWKRLDQTNFLAIFQTHS